MRCRNNHIDNYLCVVHSARTGMFKKYCTNMSTILQNFPLMPLYTSLHLRYECPEHLFITF